MTPKIRVLVVDDAIIVRRLIAQALATDPAFGTIDTASDGDLALERLATRMADVVTLDIDMPGKDGLATLREIRARWPKLPVVIFTGVSEPGPVELEALALGADSCLIKLPHEGNMRGAIEWVSGRLAPLVKDVVWMRAAAELPLAPVLAPGGAARPRRKATSVPQVLLLGASTGGPNAIETLLGALPEDFRLPILTVLHMPEGFTRLFADRLASRTPFAASEARPGAAVEAGRVWVAPGGWHMIVQRCGGRVELQTTRDPPENSCRPSVDVLFRSAAEVYGPAVLAVVLSGMGQDGMRGAEAIVRSAGEVLAQDEASSVVWGMPGAVVRAGLAARVLPLADLAAEIVECSGSAQSVACQR